MYDLFLFYRQIFQKLELQNGRIKKLIYLDKTELVRTKLEANYDEINNTESSFYCF